MTRARSSSLGGYTGRGDLGSSLVLIFPVLLAYEIGVLFAGRVNGADLVTRAAYAAAGSRTAYLVLYAAIAVGFLIWIRQTRRWGTLRLSLAGPVLLEAAVYALTLGALVSLVVDRVFGRMFGQLLAPHIGLGLTAPSIVSALGAGVHEELVFRLALIAGLVYVARPLGSRLAVAAAIAISSLLFAAAHHLGVHGEPFTPHAFAFRAVAGVAFGAIFWFRSLAHAVYAHVLYDLLVALG
ncbi:MAG TPA: CPBP family glutamic-type intramembrane protease [Kofleriaceae bacterium]|nr:CPBP family glutamic-type intramembrane protease [Kofleriaceae bacterium]